jgi:hypothetical protein
MSRLFVLLNHGLTSDQIADARRSLNIQEFVVTPENIKHLWAGIPADVKTIDCILSPVKAWLDSQAETGDVVLIQGDFGAVFHMVNYAFSKKLVPVYATTSRAAVEVVKDDGSVEITRVFRHQRFRRYEIPHQKDENI